MSRLRPGAAHTLAAMSASLTIGLRTRSRSRYGR